MKCEWCGKTFPNRTGRFCGGCQKPEDNLDQQRKELARWAKLEGYDGNEMQGLWMAFRLGVEYKKNHAGENPRQTAANSQYRTLAHICRTELPENCEVCFRKEGCVRKDMMITFRA